MDHTDLRSGARQFLSFILLPAILLFLHASACWLEASSPAGQATRRLSTDTNFDDVSPIGSGRKVALLIGNADYGALGALSNPTNDVTAFSRALESVGFGVMTRTNCTKKEMSKAAQEFADKCRGSDVALFYYSGHGSQLKGENYLWPIQADARSEADLEDECYRAQRMVDLMTEANARINIVILDACRTVPFKSGSRSGSRGLAQMNSSSGQFLIAFATDPGTTAADGVAGSNSPYMAAILNNLKRPGLSLSEFFIEVRKEVKKRTNGEQRPWETACLEDRFFFNPSDTAIPSAPPSSSGDEQPPTTTFSSAQIPSHSQPSTSGSQVTAAGKAQRSESDRTAIKLLDALTLSFKPSAKQSSESQATAAEKADKLVQEAEQLIGQNEPERAKAKVEEAIRLCPHHADAHFFLGVAYKKLNKQHLRSIPCFEAAIRHNPKHDRAYVSLAYAYSETGQKTKAIATYQKAVEIDPQNALSHRNLAHQYIKIKQYRKALEHCRKAIEFQHDYYEAYNLLGIALKNLNQPQQAIEAYESAIRIDPTKAKAYINLGVTYDDLSQKEKAISCWEKAMKMNPDAEDTAAIRDNLAAARR